MYESNSTVEVDLKENKKTFSPSVINQNRTQCQVLQCADLFGSIFKFLNAYDLQICKVVTKSWYGKILKDGNLFIFLMKPVNHWGVFFDSPPPLPTLADAPPFHSC